MKAKRGALAAAVFLGTLAVLLATDNWFGITYDEPIYQSKSIQALEWLRLFAVSPSLATSPEGVTRYWHAKDEHPGFCKLVAAVCSVTLGPLAPGMSALRTGTNFLCACCFTALFLFVSGLWGRAAGLYSVGALLLMPRVFGDCHLAALDAPIMAMTFLVLAVSWRAAVAGGRGWTVAAGVLWGLALGTKLNAFFVPLAVLPWAAVFARRRAWGLAAAYAVGGPLAFLATWPWLWHDTWPRFLEYFRFHYQHWEISVTYFGKVYPVAPWHYPLVMTAITVPVATLALVVVGTAATAATAAKAAKAGTAGTAGEAQRRELGALALVGWALVVLLLPNCLPGTPKYNGVRLFLPIFPLIAILAAAGFHWALGGLRGWARRRGEPAGREAWLAALAVFVALLWPLQATARFTPFQLSYYNELIGGLPGAVRAGMEPTYWGDTYHSAALWLAQNAPQGATIWIEPLGFESTVRLFELGPLRPDLRFSSGPAGVAQSDYAVTQNKSTEMSDITRRLVTTRQPAFTDGVDGVPLIYVFKLR